MTDWSLLFSRFHMLITPDEPPDATRGCPSENPELTMVSIKVHHFRSR